MRHRYRVDLYDDVELEARLVDLVESMPRSRRQEFLRTMIKIGFLNSYGASEGTPNLQKELPKMTSSSSKAHDGESLKARHDKPSNERSGGSLPEDVTKEDRSAATTKPKDSSKVSDESDSKASSVTSTENNSSTQEDFNIPSIIHKSDKSPADNDADSSASEDDVVDSLDEFKGLFDGLNDS